MDDRTAPDADLNLARRRLVPRIARGLALLGRGRPDELWARGSAALGFPPATLRHPAALTVEPTNACSLRCPLCPTGSGRMRRPVQHLDPDRFGRLLDSLRGHVLELTLHNWGEPTLHPDLPKLIRTAAEHGISVDLSTNAMHLGDAGRCRELVRSGLRRIVICIDGADQHALERYRRGADLETIRHGVRTLVEARRAHDPTRPRLGLQMLLLRTNAGQRTRIHALAQELELDEIEEKSVSLLGLDLDAESTRELAREFLPDDPRDSRYLWDRSGRLALRGRADAPCRAIHRRATILADGTLVPCCVDHDGAYPMGNALEEGLGGIWRGAKFREFRREVRHHRAILPLCRGCPEGRVRAIVRRIAVRTPGRDEGPSVA